MSTDFIYLIIGVGAFAILIGVLNYYSKKIITEIKTKENDDYLTKTEFDDGTKVLSSQLQTAIDNTLREPASKMSEVITLLTKGGTGQGKFGEVALKRALESSGLKEGTHFLYDKQVEGTSLRPDFTIFLPDKKILIIDSKVSITNYNDYLQAKDDETRDRAKKSHIRSINKHIDDLHNSGYHSCFGDKQLDLVIMYMNVEGAYVLAVDTDKDLVNNAIKKRIAIVGPSTVIAIIQIVNRAWKLQQQIAEINKVVDNATKIHDDAINLSESFLAFEKFHEQAKNKVDEGRKRAEKLARNITRLREQGGLESSKSLSEDLVQNKDDKEDIKI